MSEEKKFASVGKMKAVLEMNGKRFPSVNIACPSKKKQLKDIALAREIMKLDPFHNPTQYLMGSK